MNLLDDLIANQTGGAVITPGCTWLFEGYRINSTAPFQTATFFVDGMQYTLNPGDQVGTTDNPNVTGLNLEGEYLFLYLCNIGDCTDGSVLTYETTTPVPDLFQWWTCNNDCQTRIVNFIHNTLDSTGAISYFSPAGGGVLISVDYVSPDGTVTTGSPTVPITGPGNYYALAFFNDGCVYTRLLQIP